MDLSLVSTGLLLAVLAAISLGALLKGMTGLGLPLFAVPALAVITSVEEAVVLMVFPSLGSNLWLVVSHRQYRHLLREHLPFLLSGFVGGFLGTGILLLVSDRGLKLLLAIWLGLYLVSYFLKPQALAFFGANRKAGFPLGLAAGTIQGATGISAQVVAPYFHARGLVREAYAFSVAFTFLLFTIAQFTAMASTDLLTPDRVKLSLLALVPALLFTRIGISLSGRISVAVFNRILLAVFVAMELKLIVDIF
jgi:uncharacterized membrane protein YfcA